MSITKLSELLGKVPDDSHVTKVKEWRNLLNGKIDVDEIFYTAVAQKANEIRNVLVDIQECKSITRKRFKYGIQKKACKEWANLMVNEHTKLVDLAPDNSGEEQKSKIQPEIDYLTEIYTKKGLQKRLKTKLIETFGVGTFATVCETSSKYGIIPKFYKAESIFPLTVVNGEIRECVFVSELQKDKKIYTIYAVHEEILESEIIADGENKPVKTPKDNNIYLIRNFVFEGEKKVNIEDLGYIKEYKSDVRLFSIFKPFNAEIEEFDNGMGVSILEDAEDNIREVDDIYDTKMLDLRSSRRILFMDIDLMSGIPLAQSVSDVTVFVKMDKASFENGEALIKEFAPTPNMDKYNADLQDAVMRFNEKVGLGTDNFSNQTKGFATATQVILEDQDKYANLKDHNLSMASEFENLNRALLWCANDIYRKNFDFNARIGLFVQDGVIIDEETRRDIAMREVNANLRSNKSYMKEFRGLQDRELEDELTLIAEANDITFQNEIDNMVIPTKGGKTEKKEEEENIDE